MADTVTLKRIIDLVTQSDIDSGVYTIIDSTTGAVKKYPIGSLICSIAPIFDATEDYAAGAYCNYNGQLYRFTADHAAGDWTGSDAEAVTVTDVMATAAELAGKADVDGTYDYLTAGMAEQILSDVVTVDKKPYLFRRTGADATREFDCLVGGSVVANNAGGENVTNVTKWVKSNVNTSYADGEITVTSASNSSTFKGISNSSLVENHVYYISGDYKSDGTSEISFGCWAGSHGDLNPVKRGEWYTGSTYMNYSTIIRSEVGNYCGCRVRNAVPQNGYGVYKNVQVTDLTQMFGSAIADHAYTLEQATAGSGIAWLKSYGFFAGYQAYNAGAMVHVSGVEAHVMTGFNQWDEEVEHGTINNATGALVNSTTLWRSKNIIPVIPGCVYYFTTLSASFLFYIYDSDDNFIAYYDNAGGNVKALTMPSNAAYMRIRLFSSYVTYNKGNICINISNPAKNGTYQPYVKHSYPLDDTLTLRGIPKLADGQMYYDGDTYAHDGTVTRNYNPVTLNGSETWTEYTVSGVKWFYADVLPGMANGSFYDPIPVVCDVYHYAGTITQSSQLSDGTFSGDKIVAVHSGFDRIWVKDTSKADVTALKTALASNPMTVVYKKATPTTESATPYQSPQICDPDGTEQYVTSGIPVGHETQYPANLKGEIERVMVQVPKPPTSNGTYKLTCTVSSGGASYEWAADS